MAWKPPRWDRRFFLFGKGVGQSPEQGSMARPQSAAGPSQSLAARCAGVASDLATGLGQKESAGLIVYKGPVLPQCSGPALRAPSPVKTSGCKESAWKRLSLGPSPRMCVGSLNWGGGVSGPYYVWVAQRRTEQPRKALGWAVWERFFGFVAELLNVLD